MSANKSYHCNAVQFSDQMSCSCGNVWDMNDPYPPECKKEPTMTTNKPEVVAWGNDPRKMSEADLLPCPNCNHRAGKATKRAAKGLPFVGLWKVSCQRPECPLAMIYFHPVEWNRLPRIRQSEYAALQAECEKLRKEGGLIRALSEILPALDEALEDLEIHGLHSDRGYVKLRAWYRQMIRTTNAIDAAVGGDTSEGS